MAIENYSTTPADNTSINAETVTDATLGSRIDNIFRELMADLAAYFPSGILPLLRGGTGASTASGARTNLGVAIGSDVQAYSANLDEYAGVNPTAAGLAILDDADAAAQRTTLGLGTAATQNVGTSPNNVVRLDGDGALPAVDGSNVTGIGTSFVESQTASNDPTLTFALDHTTDGFHTFRFKNVTPATDNVRFEMEISTDNGSTYVSADCVWGVSILRTDSVGIEQASSNSGTAKFGLSRGAVGSGSSENGVSGSIYLDNFDTATRPSFTGLVSYQNIDANEHEGGYLYGHYNGGNGPVTNVRFSFSSGNIESGTIIHNKTLES